LVSIPHADWALTLSGIKDLYDEPGMDFMGDTTRVFARICRGMVADDEEEIVDVVTTGSLREGMIDFLKRLATLRAEGPTPADCASALTRFGVSYFGRLWEVYARGLLPSGPF
jgi:cholesterol oxidase